MVREKSFESTSLVRAGTEGSKDGKKHKRCKSHRLRISHVADPINEATRQTCIKREKRSHGRHNADENNAEPHSWRDDPFAARPWPPRHHPRVGRIDAERECRRAVRYEINPQKLSGKYRQDDGVTLRLQSEFVRQYYTEKHGQHFTDIRREQVPQEFSNVGKDGTALLNCRNDSCEIIVCKDHICRL